ALTAFNSVWQARDDDLGRGGGRKAGDAKLSPDGKWISWHAWQGANGGPTRAAFHLISMDGKKEIPGNTFEKTKGTDHYLTKEMSRGSIGYQSMPMWLNNSKELVAAERNKLFVISMEPKRCRALNLPDNMMTISGHDRYWITLGQRPNGR